MTQILSGPADGVLIIADHASNHVPPDIDLGISASDLTKHIAWDIGVADVAQRLHRDFGFGAVLASVSRLVVDCNRDEGAAGLIPIKSDGISIPGNFDMSADRLARVTQIFNDYHTAISATIVAQPPRMLLSLHSFTPVLASEPNVARPWDIGVLYNTDDRAARLAIPMLAAAGLHVGDQLPYSGKILNATMNRHGEARGLPYLGIEMRQDHVSDVAGCDRFAAILGPICQKIAQSLA